MKQKIIIRTSSGSYKLGGYSFEEKLDGSFYVFLNREGKSRKSWTYNLDDIQNYTEKKVFQSKTTKISYHSSGRINYQKDSINQHVIFSEPLTAITGQFTLFTYSIPKLNKLDKYKETIKSSDLVIDLLDESMERLNFSVIIAPWNILIKGALAYSSVRFFDLFSVHIVVDRDAIPIPDIKKQLFITLSPSIGIFENQQISEAQALLDFHHHVNKNRGLIIYSPNKEGIYTCIFSVEMRIPPKLTVMFEAQNLFAEQIGKPTKSYVKFKAFRLKKVNGIDKKFFIKKEEPIKSIMLDSEL